MKSFNTPVEALTWIHAEAEDDCVDNERFAYMDDAEAIRVYENQRDLGCCGSIDRAVTVGGRLAMVGCNYGH